MPQNPFQIYIPLFLQTIAWPAGWVFTRFFLNIKIIGYENISNIKSPVIFAVNHTSEIDPIIVTSALPPLSSFLPMYYTSLEKNFYKKYGIRAKIFYGGLFFKAWGAYPVQRGIKNYETSLKYHVDILENKKGSVCFFPEGGITKDGNLQEFKGGVAYLAHRTKTPIVPVHISGIYKISKKDFFLRKRKAIISFGAPVRNEDVFKKNDKYNPEEYKIAAEIIKTRIEALM